MSEVSLDLQLEHHLESVKLKTLCLRLMLKEVTVTAVITLAL
jgi:hypothetical protein